MLCSTRSSDCSPTASNVALVSFNAINRAADRHGDCAFVVINLERELRLAFAFSRRFRNPGDPGNLLLLWGSSSDLAVRGDYQRPVRAGERPLTSRQVVVLMRVRPF